MISTLYCAWLCGVERKINDIGGDEPFGGPFESGTRSLNSGRWQLCTLTNDDSVNVMLIMFAVAELARHAAATQITFTRLLVYRCQGEFEKTVCRLCLRPLINEANVNLILYDRTNTLALRKKRRKKKKLILDAVKSYVSRSHIVLVSELLV